MERFLEKVAAWLERIRTAPVIGNLVEDLISMTELVSDCLKGVYEDLPRGTVFGILAALFYAFSPIDLILDIIPFAGFLDDAAVIGLILELGLARDLMQYRDWKHRRRSEELERARLALTEELLKHIEGSELAAAYLTEELQIKLLLARPGDTARPLPCRAKLVPLDPAELERLELKSWEQIGEFGSQIFRDSRIGWTRFGRQPFRPEYGVELDDAFVIVE